MAQQELIDSRVSLKQCKLAVHALHAHQSKKEQELQESELLPGKEQNIWLNVTVKKIPSGHRFKPVKIAIAHPLVDPRTTPVCLITKDPQREYKELLETHKIKFISRVVGIEKLKGKFKPFEARRMLLKENGLFLADERVIPLLPKLLGVKWFEAKKQPIPVCLKRKDLKGELERAISSTYMNQNKGTCTSIKIGTLSQKPDQILANLELALPAIAKNIQGGWDNIQAFHIKTNSSTSLPIWSCSLDEKEGGRWDGLNAMTDEAGKTSAEDDDDDDAKVEHDADETQKEAVQSTGKKRAQSEDKSEKPRKKVKGAQDKIAPSAVTISKPLTATAASPSKPAKPASSVIDIPPKSGKRKSVGFEHMLLTTDLPVVRPSVDATDCLSTERVRKAAKSTNAQARTHETNAKPNSGQASKGKKDKKKDNNRQDTSSTVPASKRVISPAVQATDNKQETPKSISDTSAKRKTKIEGVSTGPLATSLGSEVTCAELVLKGKREKRKSAVDAGAANATHATSTPLTKDELRQKRSSEVGGKKKNKVTAMGGKSAKNIVLGKKVAQ